MKKFSIVAVLKNGKIAYEFAESKADIEQKLAEYRTAGITMLISSMLPFKAVATPAKIDYVIVTDLKTGESYGRFEDGFGDRTEKKSEEPKTAAGNFTIARVNVRAKLKNYPEVWVQQDVDYKKLSTDLSEGYYLLNDKRVLLSEVEYIKVDMGAGYASFYTNPNNYKTQIIGMDVASKPSQSKYGVHISIDGVSKTYWADTLWELYDMQNKEEGKGRYAPKNNESTIYISNKAMASLNETLGGENNLSSGLNSLQFSFKPFNDLKIPLKINLIK